MDIWTQLLDFLSSLRYLTYVVESVAAQHADIAPSIGKK